MNDVDLHPPDGGQRKKLARLGPGAAVATLSLVGGGSLDVAADQQHVPAVLGPFAATGHRCSEILGEVD